MWNVTIINPVRTTCVYTLTLYSSTRSCQDKDAKGRASEAKAPRYNILVSSSTVEQVLLRSARELHAPRLVGLPGDWCRAAQSRQSPKS